MSVFSLLVTAAVTMLTGAATRRPAPTTAVGAGFTAAILLFTGYSARSVLLLISGAAAAITSAAALTLCLKSGLFAGNGANADLKVWRIAFRPFALLFIPIHIRFGNTFLLVLVGVLALVTITADLVRIFSPLHNEKIYKAAERKRFSSMTAFLVAIFILFLLFLPPVAYLSLGFMTVGDLFSKLIGMKFGRTRLLDRRTLEGTFGYIAGSLMAGYGIYLLYPYPPVYLAVGPAATAAVELFSRDLDDNLTVGIFSAVFLTVLKYFFQW